MLAEINSRREKAHTSYDGITPAQQEILRAHRQVTDEHFKSGIAATHRLEVLNEAARQILEKLHLKQRPPKLLRQPRQNWAEWQVPTS